MTDNTTVPTVPQPRLVTVAHLVYALHTLSLLIGLTTAATIVGAFVFGVPSIVAVISNYVKRGGARGTFLESHFRWQIRTFWKYERPPADGVVQFNPELDSCPSC